ncbi:uncharacterized protein [Lolium perenne]|uniref:uncharacterized protein n=1 Tax=Lolium perenne TaxID=4522 RepID=UPI003A995311
MASLPPLPEDGEVEERAVVDDVNQETPSFVNEPADSRKSAGSTEKDAASEDTTSAQSPPPAVSPKSKRKRSNAEDSGTSKPEETAPAPRKAAYDPYIESIISSDDEETPTLDVAARTSTSHTLVISEKPVEGEESSPPQQNVDTSTPSSPRAPSPKRARVEKIVDPAPQLGSSSPPLLDDPMIKDLLRIGSQFIGYREYANRAEEKLAEANERADALAQKLEQSEAARKKAELAASKAKVEADEAKAKAAGVEELQKKLEDATAALDEHKAAQASRDEGILKRLKSQSRRTLTQTNQDFDLDNPVNDPLLDALSLLEFHGREIREGVANANAGLSALFPYFFPKKEEPKAGPSYCSFIAPQWMRCKSCFQNMMLLWQIVVHEVIRIIILFTLRHISCQLLACFICVQPSGLIVTAHLRCILVNMCRHTYVLSNSCRTQREYMGDNQGRFCEET